MCVVVDDVCVSVCVGCDGGVDGGDVCGRIVECDVLDVCVFWCGWDGG